MTAPVTTTGGTPGGTQRDAKLEGLRGYLALGVIVYHVAFFAGLTSFLGMPTKGIWTVLVDGLSASLPPFFVLSAFFLYRPFARAILAGTARPAVRPFLAGRAVRLIPAYYLVVVFALLALDLDNIRGFWSVARPFLLMHFYWPDSVWITGLAPTWTVPAEMLFYALLPGVAFLIGRFARRAADPEAKARRMLVPLGAFVVVGLAWTVYTNLPSVGATAVRWNLWYWPFGYYDAFAIGMALATFSAYAQVTGRTPALHRFVLRRPNVLWLGALVVFVANLNRFFGTPGVGDYAAMRQELVIHVLVLAFAGLLVAPLTVPGVRSRLMETTLTFAPMRFVGRISYGVYLWHMVVVALALEQGNIFGMTPGPQYLLYDTVGFWWLLTVTTLGSVAIASLSFYLVERPLIRAYQRRKELATPPPARVTGRDEPGAPETPLAA